AGHAVHRGARGARHHQHHAAEDAAGLRRTRRRRRSAAGGRRRGARAPAALRRRGRGHRGAGATPARGGRRGLRQVLAPVARADRREGRPGGGLSMRLVARPEWQALQRHAEASAGRTLRRLFDADPGRGERLAAEGAGLYMDYAKQRVDDETLRLLFALAEACGLEARREAMFEGAVVNATEDRAALHVALRAPEDARIVTGGED